MEPYQLFPKEIWDIIYKQVENPQDKVNLMRAHPDLLEQFGDEEQGLLFLLALPIILDNLASLSLKNDKEMQMALNYRLVSSAASKVVDDWMTLYWEKTDDYLPPPFLRGIDHGKGHELQSDKILDKFLLDFETHPESRPTLLNRYVNVYIPMYDYLEAAELRQFGIQRDMELESNEKRARVFGQIGRHLKKLSVQFLMDHVQDREFWRVELNSLRNLLNLSRNLRSLSLSDAPVCTGRFRFPELPHLQQLTILYQHFYLSTVPTGILTSIRDYFPQLVKLEIGDIIHFQDEYLQASTLFPNLKTLKLFSGITYQSSFLESEKKLRRICKEIKAPKLATLEVVYPRNWCYRNLDLEKLARIALFCLNKINKFFPRETEWFSFVSKQDYWMEINFSRDMD